MGIFFDIYEDMHKPNHIFNEAAPDPDQDQTSEDNSTTDYTQEQDDDTADNPADAPEDYTVPDEGEDQTASEADQNPPEEGTEGGGDPVADESYGDEGGGDAGGGDMGGGDAGGGGDMGGGDAGGGDSGEGTEDYTDGGEGGEGDPEGGEGGDDYGGDDGYDSPEKSDDEIKQLEDEIFSKFTSDQITIMNKDLKSNFNKLFVNLDDLVDRINDVPKVMDYIDTIEFVSNKLSELRDMLSDYLYNTYDTKSYTENSIAYKRFVILANQIADLIGKIPTIKETKDET